MFYDFLIDFVGIPVEELASEYVQMCVYCCSTLLGCFAIIALFYFLGLLFNINRR